MSSTGQKLISAIIRDGDVSEYLKLALNDTLFNAAEVEAFEFIHGHVKKYNTVPSKETFKDSVDFDLVSVGKESAKYFKDEIINRYITDELMKAMVKAKTLVKQEAAPIDAMEQLLDSVIALKFSSNHGSLVDFREIKDILLTDYVAKMDDEDVGAIYTGWDSFDEMSNGMLGGDLIGIIGRPAMGKTFLELYKALNAWKFQKKKVLFVSMEMLVPIIATRLAAMDIGLNLTHLTKAKLSKKSFTKMKKHLTAIKDFEVPFYMMDGNMTATVEDIWTMANQLKVDAVYIDGAYLLGHPNQRLDRFTRVAENTRMLKHFMATDLMIPVSCSWQFNRKASKAKAEETGLENIGFSDEIGQLSSLVLGLFEQESVETIKRRRVTIMKGRHGETGEFDIKWNFHNCDFSEYHELDDEELTYL